MSPSVRPDTGRCASSPARLVVGGAAIALALGTGPLALPCLAEDATPAAGSHGGVVDVGTTGATAWTTPEAATASNQTSDQSGVGDTIVNVTTVPQTGFGPSNAGAAPAALTLALVATGAAAAAARLRAAERRG